MLGLLKHVGETLPNKMDSVVCWADIMAALHWIRGQSSCWKPIVANRVAEIQSTWDPENWSYCPNKENPADLFTRGLTNGDMISSTLWWNGPWWLLHSCGSQPTQPRTEGTVPESCHWIIITVWNVDEVDQSNRLCTESRKVVQDENEVWGDRIVSWGDVTGRVEVL